jgi:tetratricopeptide (TPR) repeat protein
MKKLLFAFAFLSCATLVRTQVPSMEVGLKQLQNENYNAALNTFTAIAKSDPKNSAIYYYIGEVNYKEEKYDAAEKAYKKGLDINSNCAECKIGLGKLMLDEKNIDASEEYFLSASRLGKKDDNIIALIGEAYLKSRNPNGNKAVDFLSRARDMNPKVARYWALLGEAYLLIGNNGEAMTAFETAVAKDPTTTSAYVNMGRIWSAAKQDDLAIEQLEKAIELSPNDALAYKDLIEIYIRDNQYDKVTPLLEKYSSLAGDDVGAKVRLIKFLTFQAKDYDRAITKGEALIKTNPEQYTVYRWLAWSYGEKEMWQPSYDNSKKLFDEITMKKGRNTFPSDYDYWGKAAFNLDKKDEAWHIYKKYLELVPERSQEILDHFAKTYYKEKDYEKSIKFYHLKGEDKPLSITDNYYLGLAYYYADEDLKSDSVFIKILEASPDYAQGWMMRAKIGKQLDRADSSEVKQFYSKNPYEKYIALSEANPDNDPTIQKNLIEAYDYLAVYWVQKEDYKTALEYYEKILALDPEHERALTNSRIIKQQ